MFLVFSWPGYKVTHYSETLGTLPTMATSMLSADDGSLSLEEFQTFFGDGVLSDKELEELFRQIDTHKTK